MKRPSVNLKCSADRYAAPNERIIEFSSESGGGLIDLCDVGETLLVSVYRTDDSVEVTWNAMDVLTIAEIAELAGATLLTARTWTHRYADFPKVWKDASGTFLYRRRDVLAWLKATGRKVPANRGLS
jgi:hypothetical protein